MIDAAQIVLLLVIAVLTALLIILGIQVFFILRELRKTIMKANKVLDDTGSITHSVSAPLASLSSFTNSGAMGSIIAAVKIVKTFLGREKSINAKKHNKSN